MKAVADSGRWHGKLKRVNALTQSEIALWQRLAATQDESRSPFFSYEFACAVADAGADACVCLLYWGGELVGFFPFQRSDGFVRSLGAGERIGGTLNDFCGVMIDQTRRLRISPRELLRCAGLHSFEVSHLEEHQPQLGLSARIVSQGARVKLGRDPSSYWDGVKARHRARYDTLRNRERKIERDFRRVEFVWAHHEPAELLNMVIAEKRKQFARTGAEDGFAKPWKLRCLQAIARYREGRCVPVLSSLFLDGNWAALHFGFRAGGVFHYAFPVYNEKYRDFSAGLVLLKKIIDASSGHGIVEIDLGEGLSPYKSLFATELYPIYRDFWFRLTTPGMLSRAYASLRWRVQRSGSR